MYEGDVLIGLLHRLFLSKVYGEQGIMQTSLPSAIRSEFTFNFLIN